MPRLSLDLHYTAIQIFHSHGSRYWKGASKQASVLTPLKLYFKPISHFVNIFTFILSVRMCLYCIVLDRTIYTNIFMDHFFVIDCLLITLKCSIFQCMLVWCQKIKKVIFSSFILLKIRLWHFCEFYPVASFYVNLLSDLTSL